MGGCTELRSRTPRSQPCIRALGNSQHLAPNWNGGLQSGLHGEMTALLKNGCGRLKEDWKEPPRIASMRLCGDGGRHSEPLSLEPGVSHALTPPGTPPPKHPLAPRALRIEAKSSSKYKRAGDDVEKFIRTGHPPHRRKTRKAALGEPTHPPVRVGGKYTSV